MRISDWSSDVCSSDLLRQDCRLAADRREALPSFHDHNHPASLHCRQVGRSRCPQAQHLEPNRKHRPMTHEQQFLPCLRHRSHRSEEHTSELQSLMRISYAVFCLTKKTPTQLNTNTQSTIPNTLTKYTHT